MQETSNRLCYTPPHCLPRYCSRFLLGSWNFASSFEQSCFFRSSETLSLIPHRCRMKSETHLHSSYSTHSRPSPPHSTIPSCLSGYQLMNSLVKGQLGYPGEILWEIVLYNVVLLWNAMNGLIPKSLEFSWASQWGHLWNLKSSPEKYLKSSSDWYWNWRDDGQSSLWMCHLHLNSSLPYLKEYWELWSIPLHPVPQPMLPWYTTPSSTNDLWIPQCALASSCFLVWFSSKVFWTKSLSWNFRQSKLIVSQASPWSLPV